MATLLILVKSNINKLFIIIIIIIIIIKECSLSSTSPETEMINLKMPWNKVNVPSLYLKCLRVFYVNYILALQ